MVTKELLKQDKLFSIKKYFLITQKTKTNKQSTCAVHHLVHAQEKQLKRCHTRATKQNKGTIILCGTAVI